MGCTLHGRTLLLLTSLGVAALSGFAAPASAQIVFDGNIVFHNNLTGTFAGQFNGTNSTGPTCAVGLTPAALGTVTYTHNFYGDPLLPNAAYQPNVVPNFQPGLGSPAFTHSAVRLPNDGFFEQTCYAGAIGPGPEANWVTGVTDNSAGSCTGKGGGSWTYFDSTGASRQDLHLPGMPDPRPLATYANINLYSPQVWASDSNYLVRGQLRIKDQSSLTIPAGVVVFQERATLGTFIVERGGKVFFVGTCKQPIIITSDDPPGTMHTGAGGGIVINGRAKTNFVNSCAGDSAASEGGSIGFYGGNDDNDSSGELRYVRVEYSGKEITPNNELNSFTFNALGKGTRIEYCEAFMGADDAFEFFGGAVDVKHLIGIDGTDDGFDWQMGYRGRAQYVICRTSPRFAPSGTQFGDKGIEADNNEFNFEASVCTGYSNPTCANFTFIGDQRSGTTFPGVTSAVNLRRGTAGQVLNSICFNYKLAALRFDDNSTWEHYCAVAGPGVAPNPAPVPGAPSACSFTGVPIGGGRVFVSAGYPNPFRSRVAVNFTLPRASEVSVKVYSGAGLLVATLHQGVMTAGPQTVTWNVGRDVKPGVYFYRVDGDGQQSTGKIVRID